MSLEIPKWISNIFSIAHLLTETGVTGIMQHAVRVNRLGELLNTRKVTADALAAFMAQYEADANEPIEVWMSGVWSEILGRKVVVPAPKALKAKTTAALQEFPIRAVFLPKLTEADYPSTFVKPVWNKYVTESLITRRPLEGKWVLVETLPKPHWDDKAGYGNDPLGARIGLTTRFNVSWDTLHETTLPAVSKLLRLSKLQVRCPSAEEWNLIGNLFNWLREHRGEQLPDLGSTNSWEWCENAYGADDRVVVGVRRHGGLAGVGRDSSHHGDDGIGFRVLAVL